LFRVKEASMKHAIILSLMLLAGCSIVQAPPVRPNAPELVSMSPLPVYASHALLGDMVLDAVFHVKPDGTIVGVDLVRASGDPGWDRAAVDSMMHWRFTPITFGDPGDTLIVRSRVIVRLENPAVMSLGLLALASRAEADSMHALLLRGASFDSLAASSRWDNGQKRGLFTGPLDIGRYPQHVRAALRRLAVDDITEPLRLGAEYVIMKRLADGPPPAR
jgi:TonB family protein